MQVGRIVHGSEWNAWILVRRRQERGDLLETMNHQEGSIEEGRACRLMRCDEIRSEEACLRSSMFDWNMKSRLRLCRVVGSWFLEFEICCADEKLKNSLMVHTPESMIYNKRQREAQNCG